MRLLVLAEKLMLLGALVPAGGGLLFPHPASAFAGWCFGVPLKAIEGQTISITAGAQAPAITRSA